MLVVLAVFILWLINSNDFLGISIDLPSKLSHWVWVLFKSPADTYLSNKHSTISNNRQQNHVSGPSNGAVYVVQQ